MAGGGAGLEAQVSDSSTVNGNYIVPLTILTSLFFMWGFITSLNDILIPHLREVFDLTLFKAMLVNLAFFGAYGVVSYPAGLLVRKIGYQRGIVVGLSIAALGCVGFYPAASMQSYNIFLGALFVLASGVTILQVSANPFVTVLGKPETASSRLTITQAFNSVGASVGPLVGGALILSAAVLSTATAVEKANAVQGPYLMLAGALALLALIFSFIKLPTVHAQEEVATTDSAWNYPHLILGALGIFAYVGAEVAIGSTLITFLGQENIASLPANEAHYYVAYYFTGAMIGRFLGAFVMLKIAANKVLATNAILSVALIAVAMTTEGSLAMWSLIAVGLCNSIMFPTIFSLGVHKLGLVTGQGSGILCVAIVGGAIVPLVLGAVADAISLQFAYIVPAICYAYIAFYGLKGSKIGLDK